MILYKYCGAAGISILQNKTIKVTPPDQFNDPLEFAAFAKNRVSEAFMHSVYADQQLREE